MAGATPDGCRNGMTPRPATPEEKYVKAMNIARQKGASLILLILLGGIVVILAIQGMRMYPALLEYYQIEKAIVAATQKSTDPAGIRKAFDSYAIINNIDSVTAQDLDIEKTPTGYVASVSYTTWINLFKNVNLVIEFTASSQPKLLSGSSKGRPGVD